MKNKDTASREEECRGVAQRLGGKATSVGVVRGQVEEISAPGLLPIGQAAGVALQRETRKSFFGSILFLFTSLLCGSI